MSWLLSKTKFASEDAKYCWSNANYPWGKVKLEVPGAAHGSIDIIKPEPPKPPQRPPQIAQPAPAPAPAPSPTQANLTGIPEKK